jgi:hypothetical protein
MMDAMQPVTVRTIDKPQPAAHRKYSALDNGRSFRASEQGRRNIAVTDPAAEMSAMISARKERKRGREKS